MCPIRRDDDFRRTQIDDWDSWIDEEIRKAQARGEFDNLEARGKPIEIYRTDVNPEFDLAFSRLKNAGVMPVWMELDRDVGRLSAELDAFLDRSLAYLAGQRAELVRHLAAEAAADPGPQAPASPRWQLWRPLLAWLRMPRADTNEGEKGPRSAGELLRLREHIREQYLERAAQLDRKIADYHNALPQGLSHLQRLRMLPARAAKRFDERCPASFVLDVPDE